MTERKQAGVDADCILVIPVFTCYDQGRIPGRTGAGMAERVNTGTLMKRLIRTKHLEAFLKNNEKYMEVPSFTELLARRCREKELVPEQVILRSGLDRTYGHQLFNGTRRPSRDKVLQLSLGLEAGVEGAGELLRAAGRSQLYPRFRRDAVLIYCLKEKLTVLETQEILDQYGLSLLGEG